MQGRPFAWQESLIALVSIYQHFDIVPHDPSYRLELKHTLSIKPKNFLIHAVPRKRTAIPMSVAPSTSLVGAPKISKPSAEAKAAGPTQAPKHPLYVVYGSNTGTSQTFAQRIASDAPAHGASTLDRSRAW